MRGDGGRIQKAEHGGARGELHIKVTLRRAGALSTLFSLAARSRSMALRRIITSALAVEMFSGFILKQMPSAEDGLTRE